MIDAAAQAAHKSHVSRRYSLLNKGWKIEDYQCIARAVLGAVEEPSLTMMNAVLEISYV